MEEWQENQCRASKHQARGGMMQGEQRTPARAINKPGVDMFRECRSTGAVPRSDA